ncbi:MAG: sigma-70 family RNA polymerase sigma factor [Muribaculaceae bacterium]|nr:sigma-70 family RNA polymerase sigma factor [Muribaculaceae bacterium]
MMNDSDYNNTFTAMVGRHEKIIFSVCFFYASNELPFDDIRQEVLISLFKGYRNYRKESSESTWVYKVCINTCLFSLRKLSSQPKTISFDKLPEVHFQDDSDNETKEKLELLYSLIAQLNPMEKALILMWLDELSYEEIALNMGIPRNTVASRLHRIKEKISSRKEV